MKKYRLEIESLDGMVSIQTVYAESIIQACQSVLTAGEILSAQSVNPNGVTSHDYYCQTHAGLGCNCQE